MSSRTALIALILSISFASSTNLLARPSIAAVRFFAATGIALAVGTPHLNAAHSANNASDTPADAVSNAKLADLSWLDGRWQGTWGPRSAEQIWSAPKAGEMLGLFRVVENDKVLVTELYSLLQTPDGVEFRLRHFTESLVPWEQSPAPLLKLTSLDSKTAVFENPSGGQPKRITLIRLDPDNYVSRSEIISASGVTQVTEITYHREPRYPSPVTSQKK